MNIKDANKKLHDDNHSYDSFCDVGEGLDGFNALLLSLVYDKYTELFKNADSNEKGSNRSYNVVKSLDGNLLGSSSYMLFKRLSELTRSNHINPVYYLSAMFDRYKFNCRKKVGVMKVPGVLKMVSDEYYSYYLDKLNYDSNYYEKAPNGRLHQTVSFNDNPFIRFMNTYYNLLESASYDKDVITKQLKDYQTTQNVRVLSYYGNHDDSHSLEVYAENAKDLFYHLYENSSEEESNYVLQIANLFMRGIEGTSLLLFGNSYNECSIFDKLIDDTKDNSLTLFNMIYGTNKTENLVIGSLKYNKKLEDYVIEELGGLLDEYKYLAYAGKIISTFTCSDSYDLSGNSYNSMLQLDKYGIPIFNGGTE